MANTENEIKTIDTEEQIKSIKDEIRSYILDMLAEAGVHQGELSNYQFHQKMVGPRLNVSGQTVWYAFTKKPSYNFCMKVIGYWERTAAKSYNSELHCNPNHLLALRETLVALENQYETELRTETSKCLDKIGKKADNADTLEARIAEVETKMKKMEARLKKAEAKNRQKQN